MKKILIQVFLLFTLAGKNFAQVATPNYAKYYYKISVLDGSAYVLEQNLRPTLLLPNGRMLSRHFTDGKSQQWAVMPTYITAGTPNDISREFVMGSRVNGKVVDIQDGSKVQCYLPFHGGPNQVFTLFDYTGNVYAIRSEADLNKAFDRSDNNNTINFYGPWHQGGNQRFYFAALNPFPSAFTSLRTKFSGQIPFPAAPTSFTQQMPIETPRTFIQETLFPYHFITNDLPPAQQIEYSPYYKVVHYQYYRAAAGNWDAIYFPGVIVQHTVKYKNGMSQSKVTEVTSKLNVSFSTTGEIAAEFAKVISLKASNTWAVAKDRTVKEVTSFEETYEKEETHTETINVTHKKRIVTYQLVDYYELYRANSSTPILTWDVGRVEHRSVDYVDTSSSGRIATNASNGTRDELKELSGKTISVYPNPSKGIYKLAGSVAIEPTVLIQVYDQSGKIVYQEKKANTPVGGMIINISHLRPGHYVLKLVAGKNVTTNKIIKE